ncbi:MAG: hypothetical protein WC824_10330 [Bacteroidota bacterium]|jgi:hypothetical protein
MRGTEDFEKRKLQTLLILKHLTFDVDVDDLLEATLYVIEEELSEQELQTLRKNLEEVMESLEKDKLVLRNVRYNGMLENQSLPQFYRITNKGILVTAFLQTTLDLSAARFEHDDL